MALYDDIKAEVDAVIKQFKDMLADGSVQVTEIREAIILLTGAVVRFVRLAQETLGSGPEKKAAVLEAVKRFTKEVIVPIDLPIPAALEWVADRSLELVIPILADYLIEVVVKVMKSNGVLK